jgi:DNA-binding MarR family transcriptional regulator
MTGDANATRDAIVDALPAWQVLVVQHNELVARRMGVSASDLQCLFVLSRHGASTPGRIAAEIGLTTGSASRMVERLLVAGLVERAPDPHDRRRVVVTARRAALERVGELYGPLNARLRALLTDLSPAALDGMLGFVRAAEGATAQTPERGSHAPRSGA